MALTPGISMAQVIPLAKQGRKLRSPAHDWNLRHRPFQLQPFMIAPVLPGETMKNALFQYSALTDVWKNPLIGAWLEHYVFYVPFRSMSASADLQAMVLDPAFGELNAAHDVAASVPFYHKHATDPSFAQMATKAVVEAFFRNEGETWLSGHLDNVPQIGLTKNKWTESMILDSAVSAEPDTLPGQGDDDPNLDVMLGEGGAVNFAAAHNAYQALVAAKVLDVTFEDWLRTYGVRMPKPNDEPKPELLRYHKDWKYPGQAVDATDGSIAAAFKFRDSFRADKDRRFKEPGFILGLTCFTPKVYMSKQVQAVVDSMKTSLDWLPAVLADQAFTSLRKFAGTDGPLGGNTGGAAYWVDLRDLFVNGDQFINFALTETNAGLVAIPTATLGQRWLTSADVDGLFENASPANKIAQEGTCQLAVMGNVQDYTP